MFFIFSLLIRITDKIGEYNHLKSLTGDALDEFIQNTKIGVVIFPSNEQEFPLEFTNYAINKYKNNIEFVVANPEDSTRYNISYLPDFIGFNHDIDVMINSPTQGVIEFSEWCQILLPKHVVHVTDPVFVRYLFERHISSVIGVDVDEPPANLRPKDTFYSIPSLLLNYYQLEIPKGIYVYRYSDRQLLDAGEDYTELMDTNITDITKLFDIKKPFFAGYKLAFDKPDQHTLELSILDQLSTEHLDNFYVSPVYGDEGSAFVSFGRFSKLEAPFFFVVSTDINEGQSKRWAVIDEEHIHNVTYLSELLTRIEKDEEPSIIISERIDETNPLQLTYKTYNEKISNNEKGSIVYFYSKDVLEAQQQLIIMKYTAKALENNNIKIYTYDANKNDLPEIFVDEIELPIVAYVEKDKDEIVFYDGGYSLEELAHWAVEVCGGDASKLELKKYSDELDKELMDMQNTEQNMDESL